MLSLPLPHGPHFGKLSMGPGVRRDGGLNFNVAFGAAVQLQAGPFTTTLRVTVVV
ncbi:hypothetical protein GCM10027318_21740 [Massilia agilis]